MARHGSMPALFFKSRFYFSVAFMASCFYTEKMEIYLVGGAVRDELLKRPVQERDWVVVGGSPEALLRQGFTSVGRDFPVFLHPETKEEYALARTERKQGRGHRGFVCHAPGVTLEEDLLRRDLTINAIARSKTGHYFDPYGGIADLHAGRLRHVSPAFAEDPLRVLRAARFAALLPGFSVVKETVSLMRRIVHSGELETLPAERIWRESEKALAAVNPGAFFHVLAECDAASVLFPGLDISKASSLKNLMGDPPSLLFAHVACLMQSTESLLELTQRLKVPMRIRTIACLARCSATLFLNPSDAEALLSCIEAVDGWRRPHHLEALIALYERLGHFIDPATPALLRKSYAVGLHLPLPCPPGPHLKGVQRQARKEAIARMLLEK